MKLALLALILGLSLHHVVAGESPECLSAYMFGGAPAVIESPECSLWNSSNFDSNSYTQSSHSTCQYAELQGRRKSMEDRTLCAHDLRIQFPGPRGVEEMKVDMAAIFDGHGGQEASEMASNLLLNYFLLHNHYLIDMTTNLIMKLPSRLEGDFAFVSDVGRSEVLSSAISDGSFPYEIMKEALLRAINDIDSTFFEDAYRYNIKSGTSAVVIIRTDTRILVANVGDSKTLLCSNVYQSPAEAKATVFRLFRKSQTTGVSSSLKEYDPLISAASNGLEYLTVKELTRDHSPDRDDERSRVKSSGGFVSNSGGVARVNGQLAVSRAIGDIKLKRYGVIPLPEVTDWLSLTSNDSYVIAASNGVFEKLSPQNVCDIMWEPVSHVTDPVSSCSKSLADCIVNAAFEKGSRDSLSAAVISLRDSESNEPRKSDDENSDSRPPIRHWGI